MTTVLAEASIDSSGRLRVDVPTSLPAGKVKVRLLVEDADVNPAVSKRRSFADLVGKLDYKGDPMAIQREMRGEWPD
jgi:hypothetical protein